MAVTRMREYMMLAEDCMPMVVAPIVSDVPVEPIQESMSPVLTDELIVLAERMRSYMHCDDNGTLAEGVETGMQLAAEWVDNLIKRSSGDKLVG